MSETPAAPAMTAETLAAQTLDPSSAAMDPLHPHHAVTKAQADALHGGPALTEAQVIQARIAALEADGLEGLQGPAWNERHPKHQAVKAELEQLYAQLGPAQAATERQGAQPAPADDDADVQLGDPDRVLREWGPTLTLDEAAPPELWPAGAWDTDTATALHQQAAEAGVAGPALAVHEAIGQAAQRATPYTEEEGWQILCERVGADADAVANLADEALEAMAARTPKVREALVARRLHHNPDVVLRLAALGHALRQRGKRGQ